MKINERRRGDAARWQDIHEKDCAVPSCTDLADSADEPAKALRDPDPAVRDGAPYVVLRTWISRDVIDGALRAPPSTAPMCAATPTSRPCWRTRRTVPGST
ncbi:MULTISPECIES: hypothetical protein [unclassified Streptomyces]|uniref:hypothetical protein n=1 Tax=unclassified Streptomyces TaxID=2593676 RepID=UPI0016518A1F|nr:MULTISPECIES: hypothetical protein [unclassified Streptomyces]